MHLTPLPALTDNYIWLLNNDEGRCLIVDPGEAAPVLTYLAETRWQPEAILLTHHHHDHVDGVPAIMAQYPTLKVYGPKETADSGATQIVSAGEKISVMDLGFTVIATPGHTSGHISWFSHPYLFCGDTLFSGGCGRLFEGTPTQMYQSFQKINQLPADTLICCAHEYTLANMQFAHTVWPENREITDCYNHIKALREKNLISLPTTLAHERLINVFLMTQRVELQSHLHLNPETTTPEQVFAVLRQKKDQF